PISDTVPGFDASSWWGIGAPKGTPQEIVDKLNAEINDGLADAKIKERFAAMGGQLLGGSPADFGRMIAAETEKWGKVIRFANIKGEGGRAAGVIPGRPRNPGPSHGMSV